MALAAEDPGEAAVHGADGTGQLEGDEQEVAIANQA